MTIVHIIDGLSVDDGGPSYSVPAIVEALGATGTQVTLRTLTTDRPQPQTALINHVQHRPAPSAYGKRMCGSHELLRALESDARAGAVLHAHCLWLMPNVYPAWAKRRSNGAAKLVHSIRGMLSPEALRMSAWKKRPFWLLWQRAALEVADCLHATAASEYMEIRAAGLRNPVAIIPNAVDVASVEIPSRDDASGKRVILSLGRLNPKKGLDRLIRAWSAIEADFPDWRLRIVGPSERGHDTHLKSLAASLGAERIRVEGAIYDADKTAAYGTADLFVLPSLSENFGLTVAEALAAEVPVISTKGAPWQGLETHRCGWWIDHGVEPLAAALRHAMSLPDEERRAMGARGRAWVARDFSWDKVARDFRDVYHWLRFGGDAPATVIFD